MRSCSSVFWEKSVSVVVFLSGRTQSDIGPRGKEITAHVKLYNHDKLLVFEAIIKLSHSAITRQINHLSLCIVMLSPFKQ